MSERLGPELVINGGFDTSDGWDEFFDVSIAGGKAVAVGTGYVANSGSANQLKQGKRYKCSFEITDYISGSVRIVLGEANGTARTGKQVFVETITAVLNTPPIDTEIRIIAQSGFLSVDNVSVKEILTDRVGTNDNNGSEYRKQIQERPPLPQKQQESRYDKAVAGPSLADKVVNNIIRNM